MNDLLQVDGLTAGYGAAIVIEDLSLRLAGKTTLLGAIIGAVRHRGALHFAGHDISRLRSDQRAQAGIGWVPQERNIFRSLTVEENITAVARPGHWDMTRIFGLFPRLGERRRNLGHQLSGGEQQMLAIGRALALNPRLLLLDEPLEGLAPILVEELLAALGRIRRDEGQAAIIVEQNAPKVLGLADRAVILERGAIVYDGPSADLLADRALLDARLGLARRAPRSDSRERIQL